jgi:hypothetical protein
MTGFESVAARSGTPHRGTKPSFQRASLNVGLCRKLPFCLFVPVCMKKVVIFAAGALALSARNGKMEDGPAA